MASPVKSRQQNLFQKIDVRLGVEIFLLVAINELAAGDVDAAQNLLRVALAARGDLRLRTQRRPGLVQRRRLAERGLVLVDDYRPFGAGFFLMFGYV
jgi:hypothetical protein